MAMTDAEIIELLGGVTAVARMLDIKPPSVHAWLHEGIPEGRLRDLAGQVEILSGGRFTRRGRWPDKYAFYWPELAQAPASPEQTATELVALPTRAPADIVTTSAAVVERRKSRI